MKKISILFINLAICTLTFGQDRIENETTLIISEGQKLYKSQMASWYGKDIFLKQLSVKEEDIGGNFSYLEDDISKCIIFSKANKPKVIATISFDSTFNRKTAIIDDSERKFSKYERSLYFMQKNALKEVNSDTLIKAYQKTSFNLMPLITGEEKKVYVLNGSQTNGLCVFGNDYLLTFSKKNKLKGKTQLHKNITPINFFKKEEFTIHNHLKEDGDFITATDVCTLLLYGKFSNGAKHYVISENYVCIWNCLKEKLMTMTKTEWQKIAIDFENKK